METIKNGLSEIVDSVMVWGMVALLGGFITGNWIPLGVILVWTSIMTSYYFVEAKALVLHDQKGEKS